MTSGMTTVRACLYDILGKDLADGLVADIGVEWAIVTALAQLDVTGGPKNEVQRAFVRYAALSQAAAGSAE